MKTSPVRGQVFFEDKPIPFGSVAFNPDVEKGNKIGVGAVGTLNASGEFELMHKGKPEIPEGWYRVTVSTVLPGHSPPEGATVPEIPKVYTDAEKTPISVEVVKDAEADRYKFVLKPETP